MTEQIDDWESPCRIEPTDNDTWVQEAQDPDALKGLLNFAVNNKDLNRLETMLNDFNPLKILGAADFEIRHSNVLAWLLDVDGHHGLGDSLFKSILLEILRDYRGANMPRIEDVIGANYGDLRIQREYHNIDLLCVSPQNNLCVVIENKVHAEESEHQLAKYVDIVERKYPNYKKVYVLLTLDGVAPKGSNRYCVFTHEQICEITKNTVELRRDFMNTKVYDFICQYLKVLEDKTMKNQEFIDICGKLYREHREAIKTILTYGKPKLLSAHMQEFHKQTDTVSVHANKESIPNYYPFIPSTWENIIPTTNKYKSDFYLVFGYFNFSEYESHKIKFTINIGNFPDSEERNRLVEQMSEANKDNILTIRRSSKTNTVIFSKTISLKYGGGDDCDIEDYATIVDKLVEVYKSPEVQQAFTIVDGVVKKFKFQDTEK